MHVRNAYQTGSDMLSEPAPASVCVSNVVEHMHLSTPSVQAQSNTAGCLQVCSHSVLARFTFQKRICNLPVNAYVFTAGLGDCRSISSGCCHLSDMLAKLQDHANSFVCCVALGAILDANAMGISACAGNWCNVSHNEWQLW